MEIPSEITKLISSISGGMIWLYIGMFFVGMYLLISFLTWSFVKPLKYLGIPTIIVGILLLVIRLASGFLVGFIENTRIIKSILPVALKPFVFNAILCIVVGIIMLVIYSVINNVKKSKNEEKPCNIQNENGNGKL